MDNRCSAWKPMLGRRSMSKQRLPLVITLVLICYVVFALAWTFSGGRQTPDVHPTRTALPTFAANAGTEVLRVATVTAVPSATPTSERERSPSAPTATKRATPTPTQTVTPTPTPVLHIHSIAAGETMWGIAHRYGLTYQELMDANPNIDPDVLWEGQEIAVPGYTSPVDGEGAAVHTVREGETVWSIALQYDVAYQELLRVNGMDSNSVIRPGDELILPMP